MGFLKKLIPKEVKSAGNKVAKWLGSDDAPKMLGALSFVDPNFGIAAIGSGLIGSEFDRTFNRARERLDSVMTVTPGVQPETTEIADTINANYFSGSDFGNLGGIPVSMFRQPPNGFNGAAQQSVAVRYGIAKATGTRGTSKARGRGKSKAKKKVAARRAAPKRKASGKTAMQRKMARLRARRGK